MNYDTNKRYEKAWDSFLVYLSRNPKAQLTPFLKERHVNHRTMKNWMCKKDIRFACQKGNPPSPGGSPQRKSRSICIKYCMMFVPMEPPTIDLPMEDLLYGINITFPNGTLVSVKKGCAKSVMALMNFMRRRMQYVWIE